MAKFNKKPYVEIQKNTDNYVGWSDIFSKIKEDVIKLDKKKVTVAIEAYQGVHYEQIEEAIREYLAPNQFINAEASMHSEEFIKEMTRNDVTDDRIFGYLTRLNLDAYYDDAKIDATRKGIAEEAEGMTVVYGTGAVLVAESWDIFVYADMARWEIQMRMRRHEVDNTGVKNRGIKDWMLLYKQGFFVDWRVLDRLKRKLFDKIDYLLDTNDKDVPKMLPHTAVLEAYDIAVTRPFSIVPFFDPGPWGGQWMKEVCGLDKNQDNYAWCFNGVPEENSMLIKSGEVIVEIPSINLVFRHPRKLLGDPVHARFGDEFPIRYDFLDTMGGGHLSLQVHPLTEYIQEKFGLHYTQDESYYMMDAKEGAHVYLGLKNDVNPEECINDLEEAKKGEKPFDAEKHIGIWPAKKHDHFLIPAGTIHCSGADSMVLEISATPYIFTFKLWDWGRLGLDGLPRPINVEHGKNVIQWNRTEDWTKENLINRVEKIAEGDGWVEERTGLHEREFIETRRHWFTKETHHVTGDSVNVVAVIEGDQIIVESPDSSFEPFVVNYAEVFIIPANVKKYTMRPYGEAEGKKCATMKSFVRF
ncbi:MAG: class I mannose-6-phosphate isomerase [Bacteroidota bacterium]